MKTIGHHTCDADGAIKDIEKIKKHGPFLSEHTSDSPKALGTGYYFFDNNITAAHAHGENRYRRKYHIFKSNICIDENVFLDLVGNRSDMLTIQQAMVDFAAINQEGIKMTLGELIELMKELGVFKYKAIRILDSSLMEENPSKIKEESRLYWFHNKNSFLNLNPIYTICFLELENTITISNFEHHYNSTQK